MIHPRRPAKVAWDLFVGVLIIYTVIVQPFRLGLSYPACGASCYFDCLIDIPFTIDIALCFVTGYYVDGEFVGGSDIMLEMYQAGELQEMIEVAAAS